VCTAALSVGICGCAPVGPRFVRPAVPTPAQYRFVTDAAQGESMADAPWWQVFADPTLQALVREAITSNLDVRRRRRASSRRARRPASRDRCSTRRSTPPPRPRFRQNSGPPRAICNGAASTDSSSPGNWTCSAAAAREGGGIARMFASEQGRRGVLVTLVGDVASTYFLLRELDLD
jgi:multidrug efflux system outer membrane protein